MKPLTLDEVEAFIACNTKRSCTKCPARVPCDTTGMPTSIAFAHQLAATMRELATEREARGRMEALVEAAQTMLVAVDTALAAFNLCIDSVMDCEGPNDLTDASNLAWIELDDEADKHRAVLAALDAQRIAGEE